MSSSSIPSKEVDERPILGHLLQRENEYPHGVNAQQLSMKLKDYSFLTPTHTVLGFLCAGLANWSTQQSFFTHSYRLVGGALLGYLFGRTVETLSTNFEKEAKETYIVGVFEAFKRRYDKEHGADAISD